MFVPQPVSALQYYSFWLMMALLVSAVVTTAVRSRRTRNSQRRRWSSTVGLALQSLGLAAAGFGSVNLSLAPTAPTAQAGTALVLLLGGGAVALFIWAARTMGQNWSFVARTRSDHQLIRAGPFRLVRHPIYLALLLFLFSTAAGLGHWSQLVIALPIFLAGTTIRVRDEDALLRQQFGEDHARYARDVPALLPLPR